MAAPLHSAALRALAADLATAPRRDIQAVLKDLGPIHRERVEALLAAEAVRLHRPPGSAPRASSGLSPWLVDRVASAPAAEGLTMTDAARDALTAIVRTIEFERGSRFVEPRSAPGSLSLRRMLQALVPSRGA